MYTLMFCICDTIYYHNVAARHRDGISNKYTVILLLKSIISDSINNDKTTCILKFCVIVSAPINTCDDFCKCQCL